MFDTLKRISTALFAALMALSAASQLHAEDAMETETPRWSIAIHGGAGTLDPDSMTPERRTEYEAALQEALDAGAAVLAAGGTATDAVQAAILPMEDSPLFNAGRGAVYTWDETHELDSSIMDGRDRSAGAAAGVTGIKNPILLAEAIRQDGRHVMLAGDGAEQFASENGIDTAPPEYFATERRKRSLERMKAKELSALDVDHKFGTVGAVALDMDGNLAAGTSTGGMTGKRWGRVGDSPLIGAGTYADNRSCAVSATGWGEFFIRVGVAQEICTRIRFLRNQALFASGGNPEHMTWLHGQNWEQEAADAVMAEVKQLGGDGGVILVTPEGDALFSFNTTGMYRGRANSTGMNEIAIFGGQDTGAADTPDH
ncbi:isoaspartyl peptidase/L-asparaginase family protein [Altererythrobacter lutimaris]|uniref:Isoaspartyl peptidase/L-asparaginase n=1 Tax=Altererythrobacter lutimaris TaxID=2743979 RepID=A0A850HF18_9SPHN|nr:isoaspartyl peptidase/L-asparaginase [Altererythrobacter lutimaris]NVE95831.1 isoaspartyl peptidase/L-asparaginase [Altererythrobacter lutimaris]